MLIPAKLAGRCADGRELGQGSRIHAINVADSIAQYNYYGKALCGAEPGRRSVGWTDQLYRVVTCPRCLKKMGHGEASTNK